MKENFYIEQLLKSDMTAVKGSEWKEKLILYINDLLQNDFQKLIHLLYRIDIDEKS